jgi:hypothetical protein
MAAATAGDAMVAVLVGDGSATAGDAEADGTAPTRPEGSAGGIVAGAAPGPPA